MNLGENAEVLKTLIKKLPNFQVSDVSRNKPSRVRLVCNYIFFYFTAFYRTQHFSYIFHFINQIWFVKCVKYFTIQNNSYDSIYMFVSCYSKNNFYHVKSRKAPRLFNCFIKYVEPMNQSIMIIRYFNTLSCNSYIDKLEVLERI